MKEKDLFDAMNHIDDDLLNGANERPAKSRAAILRTVLIAAAAVVLIAALTVGGIFFMKKQKPAPEVAATVYLDVNPSVEITLDGEMNVLKVAGVNDDGKALLFEVDFTGRKAEDAVNELIGLMLDRGYLTKEQNALLLSVCSDDQQLAETLFPLLEQTANDALKASLPEARVVVQSVGYEERFKELNTKYGVNPGKAKYILNILDLTDKYTKEELIRYSFTKLLDIAESLGYPVNKELSDRELLNIVIDAFKEKYFPDAVIKEVVGNDGKLWHRIYVKTEKGEEPLEYEYRGAGMNHISGSDEEWTYFSCSILYNKTVYEYNLNSETGAINYEKTYRAPVSWSEALEKALAYFGKTQEDALAIDIDDFHYEDYVAVYLLFEGENGYEAYRVTVDNDTAAVSGCRRAHASEFAAYAHRIQLDELHKFCPGKNIISVHGSDINLRYRRCCGKISGGCGYFHYIFDKETDTIAYSEITDSETPSDAFEQQARYYESLKNV